MFPDKVRGHLVADLDPLQINFGNGTLFYNRQGQPDPSVVRDYMINIESKLGCGTLSCTQLCLLTIWDMGLSLVFICFWEFYRK